MRGEDFLDLVRSMPEQIEAAAAIQLPSLKSMSFDKIVIAGMGGSSIAGQLLKTYLYNTNIPVYVSRNYRLPEFVDNNTLVFIISYSGNTEETLEAVKVAYRKGTHTIGITSGGRLLESFRTHKVPTIQIPAGMQPRASIAYQFIPMLRVLAAISAIPDVSMEIEKTIAALKNPQFDERAKSLAQKLMAKVPLLYASERFYPVAYRWKTQFNENSKIHAFASELPELNHNEIVGFTYPNADYYVIVLEDQDDHRRIKSRMQLTRKHTGQKDVPSTHIALKGDTTLSRMFSAIYRGDLTTVHLALLNNIDPEAVEAIDSFKGELAKIPNI